MYLEALLRFDFFGGFGIFLEFCCDIILFVKIFMNVYGINPMKMYNKMKIIVLLFNLFLWFLLFIELKNIFVLFNIIFI